MPFLHLAAYKRAEMKLYQGLYPVSQNLILQGEITKGHLDIDWWFFVCYYRKSLEKIVKNNEKKFKLFIIVAMLLHCMVKYIHKNVIFITIMIKY